MKYRDFIENYFLVDDPTTGQLVPFKFNVVQAKYYDMLKELGIEKDGISTPLREFVLKARREGFSSFVLALFAADDILQDNPTESQVLSYKDEATAVFRKRYRRYVLSYFAQKAGVSLVEIQRDPNILEKYAKIAFSVDSTSIELAHNKAHFTCATASARTGGRGGVLQKLLFTEPAHYPDTEVMTAREIIDGTSRQVQQSAGWIFQESTANGQGNYFYETYEHIKQGQSRYKLRFFGWQEFYSPEEFALIASEFTDPDMVKQEYPGSPEEAFLASAMNFTTKEELLDLIGAPAKKKLHAHLELHGTNYIDQCEIIRDFLVGLTQVIPNKAFYVGIDCAKDVDSTVATILVDKDITPNGGVRVVAIDATGAGDFMPDWFERNASWAVHRVKFTRPQKSIMYKNLRVVIKDKLTEFPEIRLATGYATDEWKAFMKQMLELQKQIVGELLVVAHPKGDKYHDDYPDSWALAELGYTVVNGIPEGQRIPEPTTNFDTSVRRLLRNDRRNFGGGSDSFE